MIYRIYWSIITLLHAPFFGKIKFPSYIGKPLMLRGINRMYLGRNVRIFPHVRLETHGKNGTIVIEDNVAIAQNVHITSAAELIIGKSTTILANVFITNIDHDYQEIDKHILKQRFIIKETTIGENCYIGMGACIQAGTILGRQCIVGANSVVRGTFPDYCVIVGSPAKIIKQYNPSTQIWEKTKNI